VRRGGATIFRKPEDYAAFERVLEEAYARIPMRILSYVLMPTHFHLVLWPRRGQGEALSTFMRWLQVTHTQRHHAHYHTSGTGHLYQGRFKSFPVQSDQHLRVLCRYVERNPVRAGLSGRAEEWTWSSLHRRVQGGEGTLLAAWPEGTEVLIGKWVQLVNAAQGKAEVEAVRLSMRRGNPLGEAEWVTATAKAEGLGHTLRARGRPRVAADKAKE
jgi:putative transposase